MKEYRIGTGWAIVIYIFAPVMIGLFGWLLTIPFTNNAGSDTIIFWFMMPVSLGMIVVMVLGIIDVYKGKFVIDADKVFMVSVLYTRKLMFDEIKGYRITEKYVFIEPIDDTKKRIRVSTYLSRFYEIQQWLVANYPDLDVVQKIKEEEEILSNENFGWTPEQREERLASARKAAKVLTWTGCLAAVWLFFYPRPYLYAVVVSIAVPLICAIVVRYFKGLVRVDERKDSAYPTIFWAIFATSSALCLRGMFDYNIFDYSKIWLPAVLIMIVLTAVLVIGNKEFQFRLAREYFSVFGIALLLFGYSYGAIVILNCSQDKSEPEVFDATILSKRVSSGKKTTYYFKLTPWGPRKEIEDVSVSRSLYESLDKDDEVAVYYMKGRFDIPWFDVTQGE